MRIENKYLRNRLVRNKFRKKAKQIVGGEFSYKSFYPYWFTLVDPHENQLKKHQEDINEKTRAFLKGCDRGVFNAPKKYKKFIERSEKRQVKKALNKMIKNVEEVEDIEIPTFKHDANWTWF